MKKIIPLIVIAVIVAALGIAITRMINATPGETFVIIVTGITIVSAVILKSIEP